MSYPLTHDGLPVTLRAMLRWMSEHGLVVDERACRVEFRGGSGESDLHVVFAIEER